MCVFVCICVSASTPPRPSGFGGPHINVFILVVGEWREETRWICVGYPRIRKVRYILLSLISLGGQFHRRKSKICIGLFP